MVNTQKIVVILLIISLIFSVSSIVISLSSGSLKPVNVNQASSGSNAGSQAGNIGLTVESSNPNSSGGEK